MRSSRNIQNIIFVVIIAILLVSPLAYWLSLNGHWTKDSILEDRALIAFPRLSSRDFQTAVKRIYQGLYTDAGEIFFNQITRGTYQQRVNRAAAEQMLFRIPLVGTSRAFERATIKAAYLPLADEAIPASFDGGLYVTRDGYSLMQDVVNFTEVEQAAIDARIANYRELLEKHPEIHFYVFNIETLPYSPYHPEAKYFPQADDGRSMQYFLENKPAELPFINFALNSFEDYPARFFRTDQHWNIRGSMDAYQMIYRMIKEKYPDISPMLTVKEYRQVEGLQFLGYFARQSLYPVEPDILEYAKVSSVPHYDTYVDGVKTPYGNRDDYVRGTYNKGDKFYNHYRGFYGIQKRLIQYHFDNDSKRNLLMITSSYSRTIQLYIASHFSDTYIIDMRFPENSTKSLQEFIDEYGITDVLVLGQPSVTYTSIEDAIKP
jgi:hypothetical protein